MHSFSFPGLKDNFTVTSPKDTRYNCIAWAYGENHKWFWPAKRCYWPTNIPYENTPEAFIKLFAAIGYQHCEDSLLELGYEKIALYIKDNEPQHAAKQLNNGKWTSKLGQDIDIQHDTPACLNGPLYGNAIVFMRRKLSEI